jgi:hypothetical protein
VRTGTVLEGSHIPLSRWLRAILLVAGGGKRLGCKHIEEVCSVAPRISRTMRRKLVGSLASPDPEGEDMSAAKAAVQENVLPDDLAADEGVFEDVCRALSVCSELDETAFLLAVRHVMLAGRAESVSPGAACRVAVQRVALTQEL